MCDYLRDPENNGEALSVAPLIFDVVQDRAIEAIQVQNAVPDYRHFLIDRTTDTGELVLQFRLTQDAEDFFAGEAVECLDLELPLTGEPDVFMPQIDLSPTNHQRYMRAVRRIGGAFEVIKVTNLKVDSFSEGDLPGIIGLEDREATPYERMWDLAFKIGTYDLVPLRKTPKP